MRTLAAATLAALLIVLPATAHAADADAAALKRCATPRSFTTGPFFADQVKARGISCRAARAQVKRWGNTDNCLMPDGPNDHVCRAGGYRCVTRSVAYETSRARCTARGRAVGFRFGS
jgi:hypothetical protein